MFWRCKLSRRCSQSSTEEHKHDPRSQLGRNDTELVPHAALAESHIVYLGDAHHFAHRHECFTSPAIHLGLQRRSESTADLQMQIFEKQMMRLDSWSGGISGGTPCPRLSLLESIEHTCVWALTFPGNHPSRQQQFYYKTLLKQNWDDSVQQRHLVFQYVQLAMSLPLADLCTLGSLGCLFFIFEVLSNTRDSSALAWVHQLTGQMEPLLLLATKRI